MSAKTMTEKNRTNGTDGTYAQVPVMAGSGAGEGSVEVFRLVAAPVERCRVENNARVNFDEAELAELAASLKDSGGAIQPGRAWVDGDGMYVLIAGERRWRAHKAAGLPEMWLMVGPEPSAAAKLKWNLVENLQRANLRPLETARRVAEMLSLVDEESGLAVWSQASLAEELGKSRSWVSNCVAAMRAPAASLVALDAGVVSVDVVALIGTLPDGMRDRAHTEMVARPFGGAMSAMEAAQHVSEHYRRDLRRADFNPEDDELIRSAGACSGCEWNGGNRQDVGGRSKGSVCLNPACFDEKARSHAGRRRERVQEEEGTVMLEAGKASKLFQSWNQAVDPASGYVDVRERPDAYLLTDSARRADRESLPRWEQLIEGAEVPVTVAMDGEGRERRLVEVKPATLAAMRSRWADLFKGGADEGLQTQEEKKAAAAVRKAVEQARRLTLVEGCGELLMGLRGCEMGGTSEECEEFWKGVLELAIEGNLQREDVGFVGLCLGGSGAESGADEIWSLVEKGMIEGEVFPGLVVAVLVLCLRVRAIRYHGFEGADWESDAPLAVLAAMGGFPVVSWKEKLGRRVKAAEGRK